MKLGQVIEYIDAIKASPYDDQIKTFWISSLEGIVNEEIFCGKQPFNGYLWPRDEKTELLARAPFDDIYWKYVCAMIDYVNKEYDAYNNAMILFNEAFMQMKRQYLKEHVPAVRAYIRTQGGEANETAQAQSDQS